MKKETLGFIFGFKETIKNLDNTFTVSIKSGTSNNYPFEYEDFKDFWFEEILVGQASPIYIDPAEFKTAFAYALNESKKHIGFSIEQYERRQDQFKDPITLDQYIYLSAVDAAQLHINMYLKWENDTIKNNVLTELLSNVFPDTTKSFIDIYNSYNESIGLIYDAELKAILKW